MRLAVIGAGVVGICCALTLKREGHDVTVIDPKKPGTGCSYGNGGLLQTGACVPLSTPSLLRSVPQLLRDPDSPLVMRWRHSVRLLPFLVEFVRAARHVEAISRILASALSEAVPSYVRLLAPAGLSHLIRQSGELYVYEDDASYRAGLAAHRVREQLGVRVAYLSGDEAREMESGLGATIIRGVLLPDTYATVDPYVMSTSLADSFRECGGVMLQERVMSAETGRSGGVRLRLDTVVEPLEFDGAVVAAGTGSKALVEAFGIVVPLQGERGYHMTFSKPSALKVPIVSSTPRFGLVPLECGTRLVSGSDLAPDSFRPDFSRIQRLRSHAKRLIPDLDVDTYESWMGVRPSMPDSMPVIMRSPRHDRVFAAFGHGHLGITLAAWTAEAVGNLVANPHETASSFAWPRNYTSEPDFLRFQNLIGS